MGDGLDSSISLWKRFIESGNMFEVLKKPHGCVGRGFSGKDCAATQRVEMWFEKAKTFTEYSLATLQTLLKS